MGSMVKQYSPSYRWSTEIKTENSYSCFPEADHKTYVNIISDHTWQISLYISGSSQVHKYKCNTT